MDVFLCGGSGVLGRRVLELLRGRGHGVRALSWTEATDAIMRERGAEPVRGDLFGAGSRERMVAGSDAVLHLATRIPPTRRAGDGEGAGWHP